jgi:hypothetical protein
LSKIAVTTYVCVYLSEYDMNSEFWYIFYGFKINRVVIKTYSDIFQNQALSKLMSAAMDYNPVSVFFFLV